MGYLEREPDPDDQRSRRIVLTERGRAIIPVIRDAVRSTERTWAQEIGEDRLEQLRGILLEVNALDARAAS
jgi:DNA-binding MarR family transcriptional regulator